MHVRMLHSDAGSVLTACTDAEADLLVVVFLQTAFFHKASRTLLVTDAVVYISEDPPEVIRHSLHSTSSNG